MRVDAPRSRQRLLRSIPFVVGSAIDAVVAPIAALTPRHRRAARGLAAAGLPIGGARAADVRAVRLRRRYRRFRHRLRRLGPAALVDARDLVGVERIHEAVRVGNGVILLTTHGGPLDAVAAALSVVGLDALHLREALPPPFTPPLRVAQVPTGGASAERAPGLLACLLELRRGGLVHLTFEGHAARTLETPHAARIGTVAVPVGGGAAALARLTGARALPLVASIGASGRVRVEVGETIALGEAPADRDAWDARFAERANEALERLLEKDPDARLARLLFALRIRAWTAPRAIGAGLATAAPGPPR